MVSSLLSSTITYSFNKHLLKPSVQRATDLDLRMAGGGTLSSPQGDTVQIKIHATDHLAVNYSSCFPALGDVSFWGEGPEPHSSLSVPVT